MPITVGHDTSKTRRTLSAGGKSYAYYSIPAAEEAGLGSFSRLPAALKVVLENMLRFEDGKTVSVDDIRAFSDWAAQGGKNPREIAYRPARVLLQDFTGVPAVVDLAAMRDALLSLGGDAEKINPLNPVDLVIDHSVMIDEFGNPRAFQMNVDREYERNMERYVFLKWGQNAFNNFRVVPPGTGICHQVNLEYLAKTVWSDKDQNGEEVAYPDTLVGTDSHTTMVNGAAVLGWGVGGIEAEAAMLGQPISMLIPEVVGFKLTGRMMEGTTATDLVLKVVQMLRKKGVVGKFVEFYGEGLDHLPLADRATIGNMAPEYGATCGFFPIDGETLRYLTQTGRDEATLALVEAYAKENGMWRGPDYDPVYTDTLELDMSTVVPAISGPKRPQDHTPLDQASDSFFKVVAEYRGLDKSADAKAMAAEGPTPDLAGDPRKSAPVEGESYKLRDGSIVIASITSCTNTSNPYVMIGAGLVARKARALGLTRKPWVKTSLAPGSQVVSAYLEAADLQEDLDAIGFNLVGYGCTTCIGNSGPASARDLEVDQRQRPDRGLGPVGQPQLRGPHLAGRAGELPRLPAARRGLCARGRHQRGHHPGTAGPGPRRQRRLPQGHLAVEQGDRRPRPPDGHARGVPVQIRRRLQGRREVAGRPDRRQPDLRLARDLHLRAEPALFRGHDDGDARDHQPRGRARPRDPGRHGHDRPHLSGRLLQGHDPAGRYLTERQVAPREFNSYGSRRGNHEVMMRGTFANIRIRNEMLDGVEGGYTLGPDGKQTSIFDAAMAWKEKGTPLVIFAGVEYGAGSSRDWAAKGTALLGVKAVVAESFERIHRSNLVGMGVIPFEFTGGMTRKSLGLKGDETVSIHGLEGVKPLQTVPCTITYGDGTTKTIDLKCRIDTAVEIEYIENGGVLHYVLRSLAAA
jgi:aconitate hydratase